MAEARLEAEDLAVSFPVAGGRTLRAVDGVSFRVGAGQILGVVGESGCGKTTAARCLAGLLAPDSGMVRLDGAPLGARRTTSQRRAVQMIFQDPYSSLNPRLTVRRMLRELVAVHQLRPRDAVEERCRELMGRVGLPAAALDGLPAQFSGGQRQRIAIARALATEPLVLIADEPVSSLDVSVQATILRLFAELRDSLGLSIVIISHNLAVVRQLSDQVAVMYLGRIVELGGALDVIDRPQHPYTRALVSAIPTPDPDVERRRQRIVLPGDPPSPLDPPAGCSFHTRCPHALDRCKAAIPPLVPHAGREVACIRLGEF